MERKGTGRRSTPTTGKGKERRIVPPVRVLIVDGESRGEALSGKDANISQIIPSTGPSCRRR